MSELDEKKPKITYEQADGTILESEKAAGILVDPKVNGVPTKDQAPSYIFGRMSNGELLAMCMALIEHLEETIEEQGLTPIYAMGRLRRIKQKAQAVGSPDISAEMETKAVQELIKGLEAIDDAIDADEDCASCEHRDTCPSPLKDQNNNH